MEINLTLISRRIFWWRNCPKYGRYWIHIYPFSQNVHTFNLSQVQIQNALKFIRANLVKCQPSSEHRLYAAHWSSVFAQISLSRSHLTTLFALRLSFTRTLSIRTFLCKHCINGLKLQTHGVSAKTLFYTCRHTNSLFLCLRKPTVI